MSDSSRRLENHHKDDPTVPMGDSTASLEHSHNSATSWTSKAAEADRNAVFNTLFVLQVILLVLMFVGTSHSDSYQTAQYIIFRDIMAMLLIGFGYLMAFLKSYGLGAVGFTMMLTALSMQVNIFVEMAFRALDENERLWPMPVSLMTLIDAEFSAATLLISFGAIIGRASPLQLIVVTLCESVFYAMTKVWLVYGILGAEDVGGTISIHMFGAYFGLAVSGALGRVSSSHSSPESNSVSDMFSLIGTTILWIYWPSFVGATVTGVEVEEHRCMVNTVLALLGSTLATFFVSHKLSNGRFDPVHIANSTLAGGVAIGATARLDIGTGSALLVGVLAGSISVLGYVYSTPYLEKKWGIHDTCGVGNLHGWPSLLGGLLSMIFVSLDADADFLAYPVGTQAVRQLGAIAATLAVAIFSGSITGLLAKRLTRDDAWSYRDSVWWETPYLEAEREGTTTKA